MSETSRRDFLKKAAVVGAPAVRTAWGQGSPNNAIRLGVVGFRSRGRDHYRTFAKIPGVKVAFLCDVDTRLFPGAISEVESIGGNRPETNIAYRTGRKLTFDPATETFPGDTEANALLGREYREPYVLPEQV